MLVPFPLFNRVSTSSIKYFPQCLSIAATMKAKINFHCCSIKLLPLVVSTMDCRISPPIAVNFKYLETGFLHCFGFFVGYFGLLLLLCWFAPLLQTFFTEDIFCNSDHPCYTSLGTFQLIHSGQEA